MKTILFFLVLLVPSAVMPANDVFLCVYKKVKINNGTTVHKAPYNGEPATSSYDLLDKMLTVRFHYNTDNVKVVIAKDGDVIASDVFCMEADEALEYDLSECGEGEYVVYVMTGDVAIYGDFLY